MLINKKILTKKRRQKSKQEVYKKLMLLILENKTNTQIAKELNYAYSSVHYHLSELFRAFDVKSRAGLLIKIIQHLDIKINHQKEKINKLEKKLKEKEK